MASTQKPDMVPDDMDEPKTGMTPCASEATQLLKALGHEGRLSILGHLRDGGKSVGELQDLLDTSQPVVSGHLARLRHEGLVRYERVGHNTVYAISDDRTRMVLDVLSAVFCTTGGGVLMPPEMQPGLQ